MNVWQKLILLIVLIACIFEEVAAKKATKKPVKSSKPTKSSGKGKGKKD